MAPRLKILMSSGSKKVPESKGPPGSPMGPLWRYPLTGHFYNGDDDAGDNYMILRKSKASRFNP